LSWLGEYKNSLKQIEAEEVLDLVIYRPVAFIIVKLTYQFNITPNQVSVIAMMFGVLSGFLIGFGKEPFVILGAFSYLACNILDCVDGQIARLKKNGTRVGRIVDGAIDYVVSTAIYLGIGVGFTHILNSNPSFSFSYNFLGDSYSMNMLYAWLITALGGFSSAFQAIYFDYYRNQYLEKVYGKFSSIEEEIKEFEEERDKLSINKRPGNFIDRILVRVYLKYCNMQLTLMKHRSEKGIDTANIPPETYKARHGFPLYLCGFMGSTTHMTLCFIFALTGDFEKYLWVCILPLNLLMMALYFNQKRIDKNIIYKLTK
jgi:phosphatidylglycerophosphate synthase